MQMGQSVTHAVIQPTHSPSWEELLLIEVNEDEANNEGLSYKNFKQAVSKRTGIYLHEYLFFFLHSCYLAGGRPSQQRVTDRVYNATQSFEAFSSLSFGVGSGIVHWCV